MNAPAELTPDDRAIIERLAAHFYALRDLQFSKAIETAYLAGKGAGIGFAIEIVRDERGKRAA